MDVSGPVALEVFDTNAIGLIRVTQAALPLLQKSENPVVVNVSSALGSFWAVTNPERRQFHFPSIVYGASKAAVSMLTVQYAKTYPEIKFNAVEPGFTATDLTPFSAAGQPVELGAEVIVRMATIAKDGPTGTFARTRASSPGRRPERPSLRLRVHATGAVPLHGPALSTDPIGPAGRIAALRPASAASSSQARHWRVDPSRSALPRR